MMIKTAGALALAVACLASFAGIPDAGAQMAPSPGPMPGYYGPQTYPGYYGPQTYPGTQVVTNGPQTSPGDTSPSWSPQRNVAESAQYDRLVETNPAFRDARIRRECGPITDPTLRANCEASFGQYEPAGARVTGYGSSAASRPNGSTYGR